MSNNNLHEGHRNRLRAKFSSGALLDEHEILELLLFECIPRCNTNETAHRLLDRFGSVRGILDAKESELKEVEGIGSRSAFFLKLLPSIVALYQRSGINPRGLLNGKSELLIYMQSLFIGSSCEKLFLMLFGGTGNLKRVLQLDDGLPTSSGILLNKLVRVISESNASSVILVHNHPDGVPYPSAEDRRSTERLLQAIEPIGVRLVDHFIIAGDVCYSILTDKSARIEL